MRLIYSRSRTPFGLLVRAASWWGQWSHCGIVTGDGTVIHAHALRGVVEEPLPEFARRYSLHALVDVSAPNDDIGIAWAPPLLTDTPQDQRKKTEAILDNVAAQYGIPHRVVQMLRNGAEGKPLAELGPAYATGIQWLQGRGLVPAEIAPEVMQALTAGAVQPIAEQPAVAPVAESLAPGRSADGEGGVAPTRAGGGPQLEAVSSVERTLRAAGALADMGDFEAATHEAATSPLNDRPEPTDAQKAAGNYKVGRVRVSGMDVSMPAGTQGYAGAAAALVVRRAGGDGAHRRRLRAVEVRAARGDAAPELHRKGRAVIQTAVPAWTLRRKPADVIGVGA